MSATQFRIDDVSLNTNSIELTAMVNLLLPYGMVQLAVSPICFNDLPRADEGMVFPKRILPDPDHTGFYQGTRMGILSVVPKLRTRLGVSVASHGMVHVDHRLLSADAQDLSIAQSCALVRTRTFVPPFHKYNDDTLKVCSMRGIKVERWGPCHRHVLYQPFQAGSYHYFHEYDLTVGELEKWINT